MKQNKGKLNDGSAKICENCNKEYDENDNFNWSCRTHKSEYSELDNVWWCCGKKGREAGGCNQSKHIEGGGDEPDDDDDFDGRKLKNSK